MPKNRRNEINPRHSNSEGSGNITSFFIDMMELAGRELSRREFAKYVVAAGGVLASSGLVGKALAGSRASAVDAAADQIYYGGPIVTMLEEQSRVEALAVKDGMIQAAGTKAAVMANKGENTKLIDLEGKCLMPGFFDPHSHFVLQSAKFSVANLDPKPIGKAGSIADIQRILRDYISKNNIKPGQWVIGWGYDDTGIKEQRHPTRDDLDAVSTEHPIMIMHISAHLMTGNSRMLAEIGVDLQTPDPEGGKIRRETGSQTPNGVLEELAMLLVLKKLPLPSPEKAMAMLEEGSRFYAEAGITTAQDCASGEGSIKLLQALDEAGKLPIDVITWPTYKNMDNKGLEAIASNLGNFGRVRMGGLKLVADGSIQGYTAYLSKPYHVQPNNGDLAADKCDDRTAEHIFVSTENKAGDGLPGVEPENGYRGYASITQEELETWIKLCDAANVPVQVHTNGDAATDMLIKAVERVRGEKPRQDLRTTIVHAQTMREDQLDFSATHGLTPSFFPIHVYFWGDRHARLFLGPRRAEKINPARSALDRGIKITLHHDAPVAGINMLNVAWTAVNRVTTGGKNLGPEECITPFEAFRAITADAAWQNFQEHRKGTLEAGKLADLVVLSENPLAIEPIKIRDIKVLMTIKEGRVIFAA